MNNPAQHHSSQFSSDRDGSFGIWVVDIDGSNIERVYDTLGEDELLGQGSWHE